MMVNSASVAHASPRLFAVMPSGYITVIPSISFGNPFIGIPDLACDFDLYKEFSIKQLKVKVGNEEGYKCNKCSDFYPMAELNQPDKATEYTSFTCYSCREGLRTIFEDTGDLK